jgi:hypothetical protein
MAFSTTVQPVEKSTTPPDQPSANASDALLSMLLLSMYGAQMSKKSVRKLKRKMALSSLAQKLSAFNPFSRQRVTDRTLIYILLGVALVALLIINPVLVLALAVVVLILILAGAI